MEQGAGGARGLMRAHFMHAEGNVHFYAPASRVLFTGFLGWIGNLLRAVPPGG